MNKKKKVMVIIFPIIILICIFSLKFWAEPCVEYFDNFTESFNNTNYKDFDNSSSVDHWCDLDPDAEVRQCLENGYITLNNLGGNFDVANPDYIPVWINTVASNDFDLDGWPDLVGSSSSYSNVLAFVRNMGVEGQIGTFEITHWIDGSKGTGGWPDAGVGGIDIDGSGHCGMISGDYDNDGDYDFLFTTSQTNNPYTPKRIWLYENKIIDGGNQSVPEDIYFVQVDLTSQWSELFKGIAWSTTMMVSLDFDDDGDMDILSGNRAGEVLLLRNTGSGVIDDNTLFIESTPVVDTGWGQRGVSTLSVADFDDANGLDIFVGSVSYSELIYYKNAGSNKFTEYTRYYDLDGDIHDDEFDGAATVSICHDFDMDGDPDLIIGTDNLNYKPGEDIGGLCYYFKNYEGEFESRLIFDGQAADPEVYDFDLGTVFDYDQDGDKDFLIADGNHTKFYYLFINELAEVYNLQGTAQSTNITPLLDPNQHAITRVKITDLDQEVIGRSSSGLVVEYYVSNNDGNNWELYARYEGSEIHDYSNLPEHTFNHYGSKLKWKALLSAPGDEMAEYETASFETPKIDLISFQYSYVDRQEYSRTSVIVTTVEDESQQEIKLVIGGTFYFPGWQGHLRAYDVSSMAPEASSYSELRTVTSSDLSTASGRNISTGVSILWDAGELLDSRSPGSRTVYTATPAGGSGLTRTDFTTGNVAILEPILQDVNGDNSDLINFIRGEDPSIMGEDRYWKLGDINHSNPIVVGPPNGNAAKMGDGYGGEGGFLQEWQDRRKVLYVGANDGMIHCFDTLTGEELWAFIPYNLLPKLRDMWAIDQTTKKRYFARNVYVDGSPVSADVFIDADGDGSKEWRTILVCGQGSGKGSSPGGGINHYFALDITNPYEPQPLWEFTDNTMGETWSVPAIGKVDKDGEDTWVAFMGSGYDNDPINTVGNYFYAVDMEDGTSFFSFEATDVDTTDNFPNIPNAIPGSPSLIDTDQNGFADRVYVGDLDGRIWKVDVSSSFQVTGNHTSWDSEVEAIYTDSNNYPIATRPTVWINPISTGTIPRLYFGTGGDDAAPSYATYSFIALLDSDTPEVEWYLGDSSVLNLDEAKDMGDLAVGEKVWADPVVANYIVYFSTLAGSIESVDPCENLAEIGKLYGRFVFVNVQTIAGGVVGGTALRTSSGTVPSLGLASKTRSAVTLGETDRIQNVRKREVYIQGYDSTIQKLEQPIGALLKVKSWREIYRIIK